MAFLVTYDLCNQGKKYEGLYKELKNSPGWWHYLDSTWLISTKESPKELYNRLAIHLDESDSLLIIEVKRNYYGWLPEEAFPWMQKHV